MTPGSRPDPNAQPVGPPVDTRPARRPGPVVLQGRFGRAERLDPARDTDTLWDAVKDDDTIWTYMGDGPFADAASLRGALARWTAVEDPYTYAIVDPAGRALGVASLMAIRPAMRVIEVGGIVYSPTLQRTPLATEAQYLLARYVFDDLGYRRYEWKCDALNAASRRAAERLGFVYEGTFRQHMIRKGRNRDTAWYAMLDSDWPSRKGAFERWLAPENFDAQGRQRMRLAALR